MANQRQYGTQIKKIKEDTEYCFYCEKKMSSKNKTIDHIIPIKKGGSNCIDNLVICHKKCNRIKGKYTFSGGVEMKYSEMSNKEIREITFEKCPKKCCKCKSDCDDIAVGDCRKHLSKKLD